MAVLFKGMSKDNFVDGLVMKTGLNGHELFDYLMSILPEEKKEEKKEEPHYPTKDIARFYGTAKEAKDYLEILGADADTLKWFAASALEYKTVMLAYWANAKRFEWTTPIIVLSPSRANKETVGEQTFVACWNEEKKIYEI